MWNESWPSRSVINLHRSLETLEKLVDNQQHSAHDDINSALARFLIVRTCGFVEQITEECCRSYLKSKSDPRSASFGGSWFGRGRNPTPESLVSLVQRFDKLWAEDLKSLLDADDEFLSREIFFLVDRRNRIAHGLNEGIGVRRSLDLVIQARKVANWFVQTFDPT